MSTFEFAVGYVHLHSVSRLIGLKIGTVVHHTFDATMQLLVAFAYSTLAVVREQPSDLSGGEYAIDR